MSNIQTDNKKYKLSGYSPSKSYKLWLLSWYHVFHHCTVLRVNTAENHREWNIQNHCTVKTQYDRKQNWYNFGFMWQKTNRDRAYDSEHELSHCFPVFLLLSATIWSTVCKSKTTSVLHCVPNEHNIKLHFSLTFNEKKVHTEQEVHAHTRSHKIIQPPHPHK